MALTNLKPEYSSEHATLVDELVKEWKQPGSPDVEPRIFIEGDRNSKPAHVYVIWKKWSHLDRVERSEIIMDAAERALPKDDALGITIAMGFGSTAEARRLGLKV